MSTLNVIVGQSHFSANVLLFYVLIPTLNKSLIKGLSYLILRVNSELQFFIHTTYVNHVWLCVRVTYDQLTI